MATTKYLAIYLQDHHAGAVAGLELARRMLNENRGSDLGSYLETLVPDIEEDRRTLESIMKGLGISPSAVKASAAWFTEKVGRLKLNGDLRGYSPLSRLEEIEAMRAAVLTKLGLWRTLRDLRGRVPALEATDLDGLIARAEGQATALDEHRAGAAGTIVPSRR